MFRQPLSSEGVRIKLAELYALNDADFNTVIFLVDTNFLKWLQSAFTLSEEQLLFLQEVDDDTWRFFGEQCSFCLRERFEISLISQPRPNNTYSKVVEQIINRKVRTTGKGLINMSGSLAFVISYQK